MRRRLRKKKRVGEFQQLGFELRAALRDGLSDADFDAFLDRWIDAVEARQLAFGGGGGRNGKFEGFVTHVGSGSATDDDRAALAAFLDSEEAIVQHEMLELRDAWHGWD
jgi:uncharacterized protein YggL (DUF469 family)